MGFTLETERLRLRELERDDADKLSLVLSDPESMRYYPNPFTNERVRQWIDWNIDNYQRHGYGLWAVILKEGGELIGDCGITLQEIEGEYMPEIGYHIRKEYCGRGYATEAAKAALRYAFGLDRVTTVVSYMRHDNLPSRRVAEKNGMRFVKYFEKEMSGETVREALYMVERIPPKGPALIGE